MRRTTIFLDHAIFKRVKQLAASEEKSFAAVVREALAAYVAGSRRAPTPLPSVAGQFASGHADTSERVDQLLWQDPHR